MNHCEHRLMGVPLPCGHYAGFLVRGDIQMHSCSKHLAAIIREVSGAGRGDVIVSQVAP